MNAHGAAGLPGVDLLSEQDLRGSFAEHLVAAVMVLHYSAHGLPHGVEGVHLEQFLLWNFITDALIVSPQVECESQ